MEMRMQNRSADLKLRLSQQKPTSRTDRIIVSQIGLTNESPVIPRHMPITVSHTHLTAGASAGTEATAEEVGKDIGRTRDKTEGIIIMGSERIRDAKVQTATTVAMEITMAEVAQVVPESGSEECIETTDHRADRITDMRVDHRTDNGVDLDCTTDPPANLTGESIVDREVDNEVHDIHVSADMIRPTTLPYYHMNPILIEY